MRTTKSDAAQRPLARAPARALQVVELLADARTAVSLSTLSTRLGMPKTSAMHLLRALAGGAYVQRTQAGYELGVASYRLATRLGATNYFEQAMRPVLQAMFEATGESIVLGVVSDDRRSAVYTTSLPSRQAFRFAPQVGEHRPLYATGVGKLLLAFAPAAFLDEYLRHIRIERFTPKTVATKTALREQLKRIRDTGMAVSVDEMVLGGSSLAAPVFEADGSASTALLIAMPTVRFGANRRRFEAVLMDGAAKLSQLKGCESSPATADPARPATVK